MADESLRDESLIVVGLDGSAGSWKAVAESISLAKTKSAKLHIVSVQESADASYSASEVLAAEKTAHDSLEQIQIKARLLAEEAGVSKIVTEIISGHSSAAIVDYVKQNNAGLLVIGDTGHASIWGALLGTSAEKIVRQAPCSVLVVR